MSKKKRLARQSWQGRKGDEYRNGKARGHPVKVVGVVAHSHNLGDDSLTGPLDTKDLSKFLQVVSSRFTDGEDCISKPAHAQVTELLVEKLDTKLAGQERDILNNGKSYPPLLILSELYDCREKRLREQIDANNCMLSA